MLEDGTVDDRDFLCRSAITAAIEGKIEIATSTLSLVEVCKEPTGDQAEHDLLFDFFRHPWVMMVNVDTQVAHIGRTLMMAGYSKLKPADATHIASALVAGSTELQTFDDRLLALDGLIGKPDGGTLAIRRPTAIGTQIGFLDGIFEATPPVQPAVGWVSSTRGLPPSTDNGDEPAPDLPQLPPPA